LIRGLGGTLIGYEKQELLLPRTEHRKGNSIKTERKGTTKEGNEGWKKEGRKEGRKVEQTDENKGTADKRRSLSVTCCLVGVRFRKRDSQYMEEDATCTSRSI